MAFNTIADLPQDVKDKMSEDAQSIYMAAYNSIMNTGGTEENATRVAWQTIENDDNYVQGDDGKWHRFLQTSEGSHGAVSTMSQS